MFGLCVCMHVHMHECMCVCVCVCVCVCCGHMGVWMWGSAYPQTLSHLAYCTDWPYMQVLVWSLPSSIEKYKGSRNPRQDLSCLV